MNLKIRQASESDVDKIAELEMLCFPAKEAATKAAFANRLLKYANHFIIVEDDEDIVCVVNGLVTKHENLIDEMYSDVNYHDEEGDWQMVFGVETHPDYRGRGIASMALQQFIEAAREEHRKGIVLTCKENLISFYERFGFKNEGISASEHGDVTWYQMRLIF